MPFASCPAGEITTHDFISGKTTHEEYYPNSSLNIDFSLDFYAIIGFTVSIGFDVGYLLNQYYPLY